MKLILIIFLVFLSTASNAKQNYNLAYIRALLIENANNSEYVSPSLALAVAKVESNFRPYAVSHKGAIGVMQIMPRTALLEFGVQREELFIPATNIKIGIKFLDNLIKKYRGNVGVALSHYNGGSAVGRWPNIKIIPATYSYVIKVLQNSQKIKQTIPSLSFKKKTIVEKVNYQFDKNKNSSDIDILLNNIDKWLNVYNNYHNKKIKEKSDNKFSSQKQFSYQGSGTNSHAFF